MFNNVLGSTGCTFLILLARSLSACVVIISQQCTSAINEHQRHEGVGAAFSERYAYTFTYVHNALVYICYVHIYIYIYIYIYSQA